MRGNPGLYWLAPRYRRSIPACAGEPPGAAGLHPAGQVYPRVCGGTADAHSAGKRWRGLSPRVRGNPWLTARSVTAAGSIPACAGEPLPAARLVALATVYPRVCGGTKDEIDRRQMPMGLSPRVRGNPNADYTSGDIDRSIPACAGEPPAACGRCANQKVYPRVCGGTRSAGKMGFWNGGLSPRVRGNPDPAVRDLIRERSIPACAGEPRFAPNPENIVKVYPRVCGGTQPHHPPRPRVRGLSPRVRGNPAAPAHPGAPAQVYPRVCGGTPPPGR